MTVYAVRGRLALGTALVPGAVIVDGNRIERIVREPRSGNLPAEVMDAAIVSAGLIDLQVNGGFGDDVAQGADAMRRLAARLPSTGVTAFLPTVISSPADIYPRMYQAFHDARDVPGARMLGMHLEGPLLSPARSGAHDPEVISAADPRIFDELPAEGIVRLVTLAPERAGALPLIERLSRVGVVVSLGHTDADYDAFVAGIDAGATMATHLYNAMSPFGHRTPNAIGAALVDDRVVAGVIPDGVHSHPASLRLALRAKGVQGIALVTDMMAAAGMGPGVYRLGNREVRVDATSARLKDGTLAGAIITMDEAIRNLVRWDLATPAEAMYMAGEAPAHILGVREIGRLAAGCHADLTLWDEELTVMETIVGGERMDARGQYGGEGGRGDDQTAAIVGSTPDTVRQSVEKR